MAQKGSTPPTNSPTEKYVLLIWENQDAHEWSAPIVVIGPFDTKEEAGTHYVRLIRNCPGRDFDYDVQELRPIVPEDIL